MTKERHLHLGAQFDDALCEHEKRNHHILRVAQLRRILPSESPTVDIFKEWIKVLFVRSVCTQAIPDLIF